MKPRGDRPRYASGISAHQRKEKESNSHKHHDKTKTRNAIIMHQTKNNSSPLRIPPVIIRIHRHRHLPVQPVPARLIRNRNERSIRTALEHDAHSVRSLEMV